MTPLTVHFCDHPQRLFLCGVLRSQLRLRRPSRALKTLALIGRWLWSRWDCPLQRIIVIGLLAAIPIGIRYARLEDGVAAFLLFSWLAFEGWRRWGDGDN